jgi:hypothetical protein
MPSLGKILFPLISLVTFAAGCVADQRILNSTPAMRPNREVRVVSNSGQEIRDMKTARLPFVFLIRRKDGGVITSEDKVFLSKTTPRELNRKVLSDDGKTFVFGSSFIVPSQTLSAWRSRFEVEDKSEALSRVDGR